MNRERESERARDTDAGVQSEQWKRKREKESWHGCESKGLNSYDAIKWLNC